MPSSTWCTKLAEAVGVLLREPEHVGDHPHRDVLGVLDRGVDHVRLPIERGQQRVAVLAGGRLDPLDRLRREGGEQQAAGGVVERRVRRDRGRCPRGAISNGGRMVPITTSCAT